MGWALFDQPLIVAGGTLEPYGAAAIGAHIRQHEHVIVELDYPVVVHPVVVVGHAGSLMADGEIMWHRPGTEPAPPGRYPGPPVGTAPSPGWKPQLVVMPRTLPALDHDAIDRAERQVAHLTVRIGLAAFAVLVFLVCWHLA